MEENGRFYFENSATLAFKRVEEAFKGEAEAAGFHNEEDMQENMKEIKKEVRGTNLRVMLDTNIFISMIFFRQCRQENLQVDWQKRIKL